MDELAPPTPCPKANTSGASHRVQPCGYACNSPLSTNKTPRCGTKRAKGD